MSETPKLYHAPASPNSRRVRMFLAEKGISLPLVSIDLAGGEQHGDAPPLILAASFRIGRVWAVPDGCLARLSRNAAPTTSVL